MQFPDIIYTETICFEDASHANDQMQIGARCAFIYSSLPADFVNFFQQAIFVALICTYSRRFAPTDGLTYYNHPSPPCLNYWHLFLFKTADESLHSSPPMSKCAKARICIDGLTLHHPHSAPALTCTLATACQCQCQAVALLPVHLCHGRVGVEVEVQTGLPLQFTLLCLTSG